MLKETDAFDLLPEGCLQVRQLRLKSGNSPSHSQSANNEDQDLYQDEQERCSEDEEEISCFPSQKSSLLIDKNNNNVNRTNIIDWKSKRNISVIVRIRPKQGRELEEKTIIFRTDPKTIVFDPKEKTKDFYFQGVKQTTRSDFGRKRPNKNMSFTYDKVYGPESTNQEIFGDSMKDLTDHLMEGYNCTVFAYGSTGSGKTYTMVGSGSPTNPGLTVLMVESLYKRIGELSEHLDCEIIVSYLEVYNETIKDLLRPEKELSIREDGKRGIIIPELSHYKPRGPAELLKLLRSGNKARTNHATDMNQGTQEGSDLLRKQSSRSHAVFEVKLCLKQLRRNSSKEPGADDCDDEFIDDETNKVEVIHSKLVMVDLAGSERGAGATYDGARQREGASINKSLLALANCISALADGKAHIPYRNSKLTRLLKDALSGNCTTIMIANISPSTINSEDTYNTLKYADRAKSIVGPGSKQNVFLEDLMEEDSVKSQVAELQARLAQLEELLEEEKLKHDVKLKPENDDVEVEQDSGDKKRMPSSSFLLHFGDGDGPHVDIADFFGRLPVGDENYVGFAKLKNEVVKLEQTEELGAKSCVEPQKSAAELRAMSLEMERRFEALKKGRESQVFCGQLETDFNVDDENKRGPQVTISLEEFLQFRRMLGEREAASKVEHSYHIFCQQINSQLMSSGMMLLHALKLLKKMHSFMTSTKGLSSELQMEYQQLLQLVYGPEEVVSTVLDRLLVSPSPPPQKVQGSPENNECPAAVPVSNSLQSRRTSSLIMDDFEKLVKLVERPLLAGLREEMMQLQSEEGGHSEVGDCSTRLTERNHNDDDQQKIGEGSFLIPENIYEPPLPLSEEGESSDGGGHDDDDDQHSGNDHHDTHSLAEESSSRESINGLIPFYETFIPETEPEFMPHNNTAWSPISSTALSEHHSSRKKPTSFEIRFENEKQSWTDVDDEATGRKGINGLRRFPVKSHSICSTAAADTAGPPPFLLHKQNVNESREVGTNTNIEISKCFAGELKQPKSTGKKRLVDQPRVIKDHQVSKDSGLPLISSQHPSVSVGPTVAANNKKGFVPAPQSLRRLKSSRITSEETLPPSLLGNKTTNLNPFRGQQNQQHQYHLHHQNPKACSTSTPEITSEKRKPQHSQLMSKASLMNNGKRVGVGATGKKLRGAGAPSTIINTHLESQMNQGQPKNPHHQYLLKHQQRLIKVNLKKSISQSQPPPLLLHPSQASLNLLTKERSWEENNNDHPDTDVEQKLDEKVLESARSSISHKAPYHTSSKTFTIRDHEHHLLLPLGSSIPIISARPDSNEDDGNNDIPLEVSPCLVPYCLVKLVLNMKPRLT
ncbi:Kinesin-like protein KIF18B [Orchesella cincta]|uniref:Kinesin-like protein KIF18B n=1 Tax=Orchesella cincta TaxID=48709 RepID=A0A1D2MNS1_ORCCI|nr:Kinesin-like protein KIF18B [Orchesella cincta]